MTLPAWNGAFLLTRQNVLATVPATSRGAYCIGIPNGPGQPISPVYGGRSDDFDLLGRLLVHADAYGPSYQFGFAIAGSALQAYQWECEMYHSWAPRDNVVHPAKPAGTSHKCPICGQ